MVLDLPQRGAQRSGVVAGLAGARLTGDGQQGGLGAGPDADGEVADPPPLGGAHQASATGNHTVIPSHAMARVRGDAGACSHVQRV
jgi:hypothetical protein